MGFFDWLFGKGKEKSASQKADFVPPEHWHNIKCRQCNIRGAVAPFPGNIGERNDFSRKTTMTYILSW